MVCLNIARDERSNEMAIAQRTRHLVDENLGVIGAALAYLVAGIHLFHPQYGFSRFVGLLATGNLSLLSYDPRPLAFVLSAFAILLGIKLVLLDFGRKPVYALGMVLVGTYFVGYFAWHLTGHGGFLPGRAPLYHGMHPAEAVVSHLANYPLAAAAKFAEAALVGVLAVLYRREARTPP
ncbi:hypothetical protein [Natronoarchaeum rubrum]|uniref:hypothetical protein n=1 Tax=Natronoarchaeum rubrum TaxID=755311 RepID=UPI0021134C89|nr:hypothetical protein [Natronoarchaeum rubrum]